MNALQGLSPRQNYFVSLNSADRIPDESVLYETTYEHPVFTLGAMQAQERLAELNQRSAGQRVFFCGSYFRHGFHEDALWSASELVSKTLRPLLAATPPTRG
jgi:predicted NAD/FAD-binding protein